MILSVSGLAVGVGSSLAWAGLDATRKSLVRRVDPLPLLVWLTFGQLPLFVSWAAVDGRWVQDVAYVWPAASSVVLNVAANLLYMHAVRLSPLSLTVPLLSFVPVFTAIIANPILGQLPSPLQLLGIAIVVVGALLLNAGASDRRGALGLVRALVHEPGSLPMFGVALCWSLTIVVDKIAIAHASVSAHAAVLNAGIGVSLLVWMTARRDLGRLAQARRAVPILGLAVLFGACALGLQLWAILTVDVAVLEAIKRAIGIVAAVMVGRIVFAEPLTGYKLAAVVAMALGTSAILVEPPL